MRFLLADSTSLLPGSRDRSFGSLLPAGQLWARHGPGQAKRELSRISVVDSIADSDLRTAL